MVDGFSGPRYDRNIKGGGIMIYIRDNIPGKLLEKHNFSDDIEGLCRIKFSESLLAAFWYILSSFSKWYLSF